MHIDGRLRELGGLVACDVMMNNTDRIPIHIWRHTGNANNLMLGARITAIDNTCATLVCALTHLLRPLIVRLPPLPLYVVYQ